MLGLDGIVLSNGTLSLCPLPFILPSATQFFFSPHYHPNDDHQNPLRNILGPTTSHNAQFFAGGFTTQSQSAETVGFNSLVALTPKDASQTRSWEV